ncbi:MAG: hypothetical protein V2J26_11125 [Pacificimonas sp.]|jgi:chromosomal replication initiation ATPase DnaA|nr:hypothetical protein [Pacificimonas sp.]
MAKAAFEQFGLPLDGGGTAADDFIVTPANADAAAGLQTWDRWPDGAVLLVGPAQCGKTRLAQIAKIRRGGHLDLWEDVDRGGLNQAGLFHALNRARDGGDPVLMTARTMPGRWAISLPDLKSRVNALPILEIHAPDDALVAELLYRGFAQRGLDVGPDLIAHASLRVPRAYRAIAALAERADRAALEQGRKISVRLLAPILDALNDESW